MPEASAGRPHQLVWMRSQRPGRGPKPAHSLAAIAEAAIKVADADGLDAVSMRRIAREIGAGTMSLYRYVQRKDDLIDLMVDRVVEETGLPNEPAGEWRTHQRLIARTRRAMSHRHPWLIIAESGHPRIGPNTLLVFEHALQSLDGLGLDIDQMMGVLGTVEAFVVGFVHQELAEDEARRRTGMTEDDYRQMTAPYLRMMLATGDYPMVRRMIIDAEDYPDRDAVFEWRLDRVLDGVASAITAPRAPAADAPPLGPPTPPNPFTMGIRAGRGDAR